MPTTADDPSAPYEGPGPYFVACGARSGSTLLRVLIDQHPDISCPSETDLALLLNSYLQSTVALGARSWDEDPLVLPSARKVVDELMQGHLARVGKSRWCDKSLSNVDHLGLLAATWPESRFVLLHRHPMDFAVSALEASPWGLTQYDFARFANGIPGNSLLAMIAYWIDRTTRLLQFEERAGDRCFRLKYEDLVTRTRGVLRELWGYFGVSAIEYPDRLSPVVKSHDSTGPADHKVWYTNGVNDKSVGQGVRVPVDSIPDGVLATVNDLLQRLGYAMIGNDWGSGGEVVRHRATWLAEALAAEDSIAVELRIMDGGQVTRRSTVDLSLGELVGAVDHAEGPESNRSTIATVAVDRLALTGLSEGTLNIGRALRERSVRYYGPSFRNFGDEQELFGPLAKFLTTSGTSFFDQAPHGGG